MLVAHFGIKKSTSLIPKRATMCDHFFPVFFVPDHINQIGFDLKSHFVSQNPVFYPKTGRTFWSHILV